MRRQTGRYVASALNGQGYRAFVPAPLPPDPPLQLDHDLAAIRDRALVALGELKGITRILPDARLFLYQYVRKEALLSSQIEGTQSSLTDLLLFELDQAPGVPLDDVREVSNYIAALEHGLQRMRQGFPLSLRLLREMHALLLRRGRGSGKAPGEFRRTPVWIGGPGPGQAQFVPPPADRLADCLGALERFLHATGDGISPLARAGLAHVQFETIHPFLDGNGRVGRLLIVLMLCDAGLLDEPSLYLSLFFKSRRDEYYQRLDAVRTQGDWEGWLQFFFEGVVATSGQAVDTAQPPAAPVPGRSGATARHRPDRRHRIALARSVHPQPVADDRPAGAGNRTVEARHRPRPGRHGGFGHVDTRDHGQAALPDLRLPALPGHPERRGAAAVIG